MKTIILIKTAIFSILRHTLRSLLTIIGIMIGIAAIVITFSIGRGAEETIKNQIMTMGEGACYIIPGNILTKGAVRAALGKTTRLTMQDLEAIKAQVPEIKEISPSTYTLEMMEYKGAATKDRIMGTYENSMRINKNKLKYGTFFTKEQVEHRSNVAIIGADIEEKLFGKEYPIGKTIRINGNPFEVIGVVEKQDHFWSAEDPNRRTFVPFTVAKKFFSKPDESEDDLGAIAIGFYEDIHTQDPLRVIRRILRFRHNLDETEEDDFSVFDQQSISRAAEDAAAIIKLFGLIAASISLLVGGIGIMNIMFVSVQERTQEIGLRMAVGATRFLVQAQFLLEAIFLCSMGGFIGIMLGFIGQKIISHLSHLPSIFEFTPLILSFAITVLIGLVFGFYPARKASLLNPIDALLER